MSIEMMQEFAQANEINLIAFHGNRKCVHQEAESSRWLTLHVWDEHGYFSRCSRPYVQTPLWKWIGTSQARPRSQSSGAAR